MLALLASNVASIRVFTSKKSGVPADDRAAKHHHRMVGCVFPLFLCFSFFTIFHIDQRCGVLCFTMIFPKGVHVQLDGWPWNGEGVLGAKGCAGTQCWSSSNQGKVEC